VCVDVPSHEVHQDTDTGRLEPGDQDNSTLLMLPLLLARSLNPTWGTRRPRNINF
jgi:hypothetical protein